VVTSCARRDQVERVHQRRRILAERDRQGVIRRRRSLRQQQHGAGAHDGVANQMDKRIGHGVSLLRSGAQGTGARFIVGIPTIVRRPAACQQWREFAAAPTGCKNRNG
jgi:hypothetical protein